MTAVAALVQAVTMSWLIGQTGANSGAAGAIIGLYVGLGFIAAAMFAEVLFAGRHPRLYAITAGYSVVAAIVQGAIIGFLGSMNTLSLLREQTRADGGRGDGDRRRREHRAELPG